MSGSNSRGRSNQLHGLQNATRAQVEKPYMASGTRPGENGAMTGEPQLVGATALIFARQVLSVDLRPSA